MRLLSAASGTIYATPGTAETRKCMFTTETDVDAMLSVLQVTRRTPGDPLFLCIVLPLGFRVQAVPAVPWSVQDVRHLPISTSVPTWITSAGVGMFVILLTPHLFVGCRLLSVSVAACAPNSKGLCWQQ